MTDPLPIACTLAPDELPERLAEIRAVSREALCDKAVAGTRAVLSFDPAPGVRERLAAIVAAEARCCAFLAMTLAEGAGGIALTIDAPPDAAPVLAELVAAFEIRPGTQSSATPAAGRGATRPARRAP
jgi:hypothetical protein